ncbi:MAG: helix-turn-helix domain-containing protein [Eggerthellaceae bacterium]|jgi:DNA-binding CsgD family transcriptional regulator
MLVALFYYTLAIMFMYMIAGAISMSAYLVSRRKTFLFLAIAFIFYFLDVSLVFKDDFITPQLVLNAQSFWEVGSPMASIVTGSGTFLFLWFSICEYLEKRNWWLRILPIVIFAVASYTVFQVIGNVQWREFTFYSMRTLLIYVLIGIIFLWRLRGDTVTQASIKRHGIALLLVFIFNTCMLAENIYFQLIFDPSLFPKDMWFFAERSPSENLSFLVIAIVTIRVSAETLRLRYDKPPERIDNQMSVSIARNMPAYAQRYSLSSREQDVMVLVIMGKDNQNIATELCLSPSTVKVHIHNILKKTGQENRKALIQDFWSK